ncbi:DUF1127 domain-containing protein [Pseudomonas entomophila]|uniref:DUF1127 domain-containing protein n=1 Tax=Pseudomonas entomophila TaxID=312306 RepID=UPI0023D84E28|nr:DUF1127 domain-containing protein [Pseudomonas entomophila]MDF0733330.1 DUF1127 domain-containing protein [Pseudomonas entomophila]
MNGLSDVRLQLLAEELTAGQRPKVYSAPQGLGRIGLMLHRWRTRKALLALSDEQLFDIGVSRQQARVEGRKPFWLE